LWDAPREKDHIEGSALQARRQYAASRSRVLVGQGSPTDTDIGSSKKRTQIMRSNME
jgi:hypothetical protein